MSLGTYNGGCHVAIDSMVLRLTEAAWARWPRASSLERKRKVLRAAKKTSLLEIGKKKKSFKGG